ncbi:MAG: TraR/DksA family transcriptional regulator [Mycobacteriales bacterium]|jgi:DnaK suppressor protein
MADDTATALDSMRTELEAHLQALQTPAGDHGGISFGKRVGDGTSVAVERFSQVAAHDRLRAMLTDVIRAQAKLADGTYGSCDRCRGAIARERLEALPWATHCRSCATSR